MIKILFLLLFTSCSFLVDTYQKDILSEQNIKPLDKTEKTYCPIIQKKILINESQSSQKLFEDFLVKVSQSHYLSFIDQAVLWSLLQINLRPDQNSPTSKLQFLMNYNNKEYYFNVFSNKDDGYPYLYLLDHILKNFGSKYSLLDLTKLYDQYMPPGIQVTEDFEIFLNENKAQLAANENFNKFYLRGDETLRKNERLPNLKLQKFVMNYLKTKNLYDYQIKNFLFKYKENTSFVPNCNFDMNLYENSIFLISKNRIMSSIFGMKTRENIFMAVSSQNLGNLTPLENSMIFKGSSQVRSASLCSFKNRLKPDHRLWLVSSASRDPGQHLYHLMEYGIGDVKTLKDLDSMLKFSRHLFLKNPVRLVFESKRSDQSQVQELLKLDIPLYNAKSLGKIWSYYQNDNEASFLLDARRLGVLSCQSN